MSTFGHFDGIVQAYLLKQPYGRGTNMPIDVEKIIMDALLSLNDEKPLSKITVGDIIERANVGRQTFYNHFRDKFELINRIYKSQVVELFACMENGLYNSICETQKSFMAKRSFFSQALKLTGPNSLREYMYEECVLVYRNYIETHYGKHALTEEVLFAIDFYSYGVANMLIRQCVGGLSITREQKATYVINCMPDVLKQYMTF